ncbi:hypothetical protein mvi_22440 [Methylobacterium indicum]|uniref:Uncharacterized protein n=1 Tax=Methylobacterium indicum TaxID=1775910 RepID=A0A8H8WSR1_9HYPH|nr:hypothetical protein mvi_22440 [Methylobacterium indicum]
MTETHHDGTPLDEKAREERSRKAEQRRGGPPARPHMTVTDKPDPSPHDVEKRRKRQG